MTCFGCRGDVLRQQSLKKACSLCFTLLGAACHAEKLRLDYRLVREGAQVPDIPARASKMNVRPRWTCQHNLAEFKLMSDPGGHHTEQNKGPAEPQPLLF